MHSQKQIFVTKKSSRRPRTNSFALVSYAVQATFQHKMTGSGPAKLKQDFFLL